MRRLMMMLDIIRRDEIAEAHESSDVCLPSWGDGVSLVPDMPCCHNPCAHPNLAADRRHGPTTVHRALNHAHVLHVQRSTLCDGPTGASKQGDHQDRGAYPRIVVTERRPARDRTFTSGWYVWMWCMATYSTSPLVVMMATVASPGYACTMRSRQPMTRASSSSVCRSVMWLTPLARVQHPSIAGQQRREGGDASWLAAGAGYLQIGHEPKHQFIRFDHALQPLVDFSSFPPDP